MSNPTKNSGEFENLVSILKKHFELAIATHPDKTKLGFEACEFGDNIGSPKANTEEASQLLSWINVTTGLYNLDNHYPYDKAAAVNTAAHEVLRAQGFIPKREI